MSNLRDAKQAAPKVATPGSKGGKPAAPVAPATATAKTARKVHAKTLFGHWQDSVRGTLDTLLAVAPDNGLTVAQLAEKANVSEARVRVHLGDLRQQHDGHWGPNVTVCNVGGKYSAMLTPKETK